MTFTYALADDIGKVRFELGDTTSGEGVRADGSNLSNEEIQHLLDREGTVMLAVAAACEMLARDWARAASYSTGPRSEQIGRVSAEWAARGIEARNKQGGNYAVFSATFKREDGYSEEAA